MGPGTPTAWQHDARPLGADSFSVFDNGGPPSAERHSRGAVVRIDRRTATASLVTTVAIPTPIFAETQGDLQQLPDRNWWIGWGNINESSEVRRRQRASSCSKPPPGRVGDYTRCASPGVRRPSGARRSRLVRSGRAARRACLRQLERCDRGDPLAPGGRALAACAAAAACGGAPRLRDAAAGAGLRTVRGGGGARRRWARARALADGARSLSRPRRYRVRRADPSGGRVPGPAPPALGASTLAGCGSAATGSSTSGSWQALQKRLLFPRATEHDDGRQPVHTPSAAEWSARATRSPGSSLCCRPTRPTATPSSSRPALRGAPRPRRSPTPPRAPTCSG